MCICTQKIYEYYVDLYATHEYNTLYNYFEFMSALIFFYMVKFWMQNYLY